MSRTFRDVSHLTFRCSHGVEKPCKPRPKIRHRLAHASDFLDALHSLHPNFSKKKTRFTIFLPAPAILALAPPPRLKELLAPTYHLPSVPILSVNPARPGSARRPAGGSGGPARTGAHRRRAGREGARPGSPAGAARDRPRPPVCEFFRPAGAQ